MQTVIEMMQLRRVQAMDDLGNLLEEYAYRPDKRPAEGQEFPEPDIVIEPGGLAYWIGV